MGGRMRVFLYSFGNLAAAVSYQSLSFYALYFYVDLNRFPKRDFALIWLIFGIWNAINDPLLGQWSDRTRTRWGRRIPFIALGMIPYALFYFLLWTPPFHWAGGRLFWYVLAVFFLFDGLFTLVTINWTALFPEMFPTLAERATVSAWRQVFSIVGLAVAMALPPFIYNRWQDSTGVSTLFGWRVMGAVLAAITLAATITSLLGSRERPDTRKEAGIGLAAALRHTFGNKAALAFLAANFGNYLAIGIVQMTFALFIKYNLKIADTAMPVMLGASFIVALLVLPLWRAITISRGPRHAQILSAAAFGLACLGFIFAGDRTEALIVCGLLGLGLSGLIMIPDILIADVADDDELRTGTRREGMFFGVNGACIRLAGAAQGLVVYAVLAAFGYDEQAVVQAISVQSGIRLLMSVAPILAMVLVIAAMLVYPLHGGRLAAVKEALARKRAS